MSMLPSIFRMKRAPKATIALALAAASLTQGAIAAPDLAPAPSSPMLLAQASGGVSQQAADWEARARSLRQHDLSGAIDAMRRATELEDRAYRRFELGEMLRAAGRDEEALTELQRANALDPNNPDIHFALGYAALKDGNDARAISWFEKGLAARPGALGPREDLAYAYKRQERNAQAVEAFKKVVDNGPNYPRGSEAERDDTQRRIYNARREISELDRRFYANAFAVYRDESSLNAVMLPEAGPSISQAGGEIGWRPGKIGYRDGRMVTVYARAFGSALGDDFQIDEETWQGGFGIRVKPLKRADLQLTLERMVKLGDFSRNAWLSRVSYFWGDGGELRPYDKDWHFQSYYFDAAAIPDEPNFNSLFFEGMEGHRFLLHDRLTVTPHLVLSAYRTEDPFQKRVRIEAGPGVSFNLFGRADTYHAEQSSLELRAQYRFGLRTNGVNSDDAVVVGLYLQL